jgi:transcriptional regulator GlxA family with amidase domain
MTVQVVDIVVYDGVDELDALGPLEVLRSAARLGADLEVRLATRERRAAVTGAFGLQFAPDVVYRPGDADLTIVTGGGWVNRADVGAWGEVARGDWPALLQASHRDDRILAGVCTGTMLLAHAGVIGGRRATTHHDAWNDLAATGATLVQERVVDDGDLITCGGVTSGLDLALHIVARECSAQIADRVADRMEHGGQRSAWAKSLERSRSAST